MKRDELKALAVGQAIADLKDFQRETVEYVFAQLLDNGRNKMLVADEVGLGKTIVARGLIAKAFEKHLKAGNSREFHVIYICSNQALAAQNLKKLNLFKNDEIPPSIERLIYLARKPDSVVNQFRLSSLTPGTSFYLTGGSGHAEERLVLFTLLSRYKFFQNHQNGLQHLMIGPVRDPGEWKTRSIQFQKDNRDEFRRNIFKTFKAAIQKKRLIRSEHKSIFNELGLAR